MSSLHYSRSNICYQIIVLHAHRSCLLLPSKKVVVRHLKAYIIPALSAKPFQDSGTSWFLAQPVVGDHPLLLAAAYSCFRRFFWQWRTLRIDGKNTGVCCRSFEIVERRWRRSKNSRSRSKNSRRNKILQRRFRKNVHWETILYPLT